MMNFDLPYRARLILDKLMSHSYEAYVVGGSLRDAILRRESHDVDITTNALPHEIIEVFEGEFRVYEIGIKYGTVSVIVDDMPIEITTYRSEAGYIDGRRPESVKFERDIALDLSRRDFTINAMAYNEENGLVDLFNGIEDLKNRQIRCVGNAKQRFEEDKLRMLRAIRFASTLDFEIESESFDAIKELAGEISSISVPRINQELTKMLLIDKPSKAMLLLRESGLLKHILPVIDQMHGFDQQNPYHTKDLFFHTMEVLDGVESDIVLRLAALFHDTGKLYTKSVDENGVGHFYGHDRVSRDVALRELKNLQYSNAIINLVSLLAERHMIAPGTITSKGIRKLINLFGEENIHYLIKLQQADSKATTLGENHVLEDKVNEVLNEEHVFSRLDLKVNGHDIMQFGYSGRQIREVTDYLMEIVLGDPTQNVRDTLLNLISQYQKANNHI